MKVILVGLPYFSKELARILQVKFPDDQFISLDTYYSKKDQIKYLFHIFSADVVHSINGTLGKSKVLELGMFLKKKIIFHWVGTDLIKSTELYKNNLHNPKFITYPLHLTDSPWFIENLNKIQIKAQFVPIKGFEKSYDTFDFQKEFSVLCYISQHRAEYYGIELLIEIAKKLPHIQFDLVGIESYSDELPPNMILHGWVDNMTDWIKKSVVCLRLPKTDGLSFFVLESLALQRYVAYNQNFEYSDYCKSADDFVSYIHSKKQLFDEGNLPLNRNIANQLVKDFKEDKVLETIMDIYK